LDEKPGVSADDSGEAELEFSVSSLRPVDRPPGHRLRHFNEHFWYRLYRFGGSIALAALLVTGVAVWIRPALPGPSHPLPHPDPLSLYADAAGLSCIHGAAWSPDSARIAMIGSSACNKDDEKLVVFDARTGFHLSALALDPPVIMKVVPPAVQQDPPTLAEVSIDYSQPLWSPNGQSIAVSYFAVQLPSSNAPERLPLYGLGIVVVAVATGNVRVLVAPAVQRFVAPPDAFRINTHQRWDLAQGTVDNLSVLPALSYRWASGGSLTATDLVPAAPSTSPPTTHGGPVGNPIGGGSFTIWQSGSVQGIASGCGLGGPTPYSSTDYYLLTLSTPAWSPDGRYLLPGVYTRGRLPLPPPPPGATLTPQNLEQQTGSGCADFGPASQWPLLPLRDAGLQAALLLVANNTQPSITFTWRPDGQRLAVTPLEITNGAPALTIYDCRTGRMRAQVSVDEFVPVQVDGRSSFDVMAWSPDGQRLLLVPSEPNAIAYVLGPKSLGG
jgi:WD40-like Beta Propeller Repeat